MRADQVEAAWSEVTPILECWEGVKPPDRIIEGDGGWHNPKSEEAIG
jgi:glucose-6-phosphate 1-dehydrogenase